MQRIVQMAALEYINLFMYILRVHIKGHFNTGAEIKKCSTDDIITYNIR